MANPLAALGRKHYVSQSALEALLNELKEAPLPEAGSRRTIKRARDEHVQVQTPFGSLITDIAVKLQKDESQVKLPVLNLPAFLWHLCHELPQFAAFVQTRMHVQLGCSASEWARSCLDHDTVLGRDKPGESIEG